MERRFPDDLKNYMTRYYLIPKNVRNLPPDATESLSVAFDEDLPCKGDFSMEKKGRDIQLVIILFIKIYLDCNLHYNLQTKTFI